MNIQRDSRHVNNSTSFAAMSQLKLCTVVLCSQKQFVLIELLRLDFHEIGLKTRERSRNGRSLIDLMLCGGGGVVIDNSKD